MIRLLRCTAAVAVFALLPSLTSTAAVPPEQHVTVSRSDFQGSLRGRAFERWQEFKAALGKEAALRQPEVGGDVRLASGLSIAVVVIVNVIVWAVISFIVAQLAGYSTRIVAWAVFLFLCVYALLVNMYCQYAYSDPKLRVVTNFLFGMVPLAVSMASYILALLMLDFVRGQGFSESILARMKPWEEHVDGRLIFFLAVLPGLAVSIYLGNTVSTGFDAAATHFDVLSFCLFIDVARFVGHLAYLIAPRWTIGASQRDIGQQPGLCYVLYALSLWWFFVLAAMEAGRSNFLLADRTKIRTLACLDSFVFFPLSLYLTAVKIRGFFAPSSQFLETVQETVAYLAIVFLTAMFMLFVGVVFDAIEPNLMGIAALLWVVFFGAYRFSTGLLTFILTLIPLAALALGAAILSTRHAGIIKEFVLAALSP